MKDQVLNMISSSNSLEEAVNDNVKGTRGERCCLGGEGGEQRSLTIVYIDDHVDQRPAVIYRYTVQTDEQTGPPMQLHSHRNLLCVLVRSPSIVFFSFTLFFPEMGMGWGWNHKRWPKTTAALEVFQPCNHQD